MMTRRVGVLLLTLSLALSLACGRQAAEPLPLADYTLQQAADSIPLPYRQDVRVGDVLLRLDGVPQDSRCPKGVTCVWEGDAVATLLVQPGCITAGCAAPSMQLSLHTTLEPRAGNALGYRVQLLTILPAPVYQVPVDSSRYVAWVRLTR